MAFSLPPPLLTLPPWLDWLLENRYTEAVASGRTLLDRLSLQPDMKVLDVGCGPGRLALPAAEQVGPDGEVEEQRYFGNWLAFTLNFTKPLTGQQAG